ncbi:hypothetical protein JTB14_018454 [Gonioctena quinquepunctata]|nr:hypothetical protein JTB14_018454 [Gonioctena quinquepunctata]
MRAPDYVLRDLRAIVQSNIFSTQVMPYLQLLSESLHKIYQDRRNKYVNEHRCPLTFQVGDKVLVNIYVLSKGKFAPKRDGPYKIVQVVSPSTYGQVSYLTLYAYDDDPLPVRPLWSADRPDPPTVLPEMGDHAEGPSYPFRRNANCVPTRIGYSCRMRYQITTGKGYS